MRPLKILHLAPLWFPVAHDSLGGVETFLTDLLETLEGVGCRNTLIATGDSRTAAELVSVTPLNLCVQMEAGSAAEYAYYEQQQLWLALDRAPRYDIVHSHIGSSGYVLSSAGNGIPVLHTQHNPVYEDQEWFVGQHPHFWYSTVSQFQAKRLTLKGATNCRVIHNGIDVARFTFQPRAGNGLFFLGRMEDEKGPDLAVQVARRLDRELVLAGPIIDEEFFEQTVKPFLDERIRYIGVVDHRQKTVLFGRAACVLMPSRVDEGFGIVSLEAMACGTPVVALANGSLPEIVDPGVTGYLTSDEEELATLVIRAVGLDRAAIRGTVAERFDIHVVAARYRQLYEEIAAAERGAPLVRATGIG